MGNFTQVILFINDRIGNTQDKFYLNFLILGK